MGYAGTNRSFSKICEECGNQYEAPTGSRKKCDDCRKCLQCGGPKYRSEKKFCSWPCYVQWERDHGEKTFRHYEDPEKYDYETLQYGREKFLIHRLEWERANGPIPKGMDVHHINGDTKDNRLENLIAVTRGEHRRLHSPRFRIDAERNWERCCPACDEWKGASSTWFEVQKVSEISGHETLGVCKLCAWQRRHAYALPPANCAL